MKTISILITFGYLFFLFSCSEEKISSPENISPNNPRYTTKKTAPTEKWYADSPLLPKHCEAPKKDCVPKTILTPEKKVEDIILADHINNNTVYQYFQASNQQHYDILFPNFTGPALLDLRANITTIRKIVNKDFTVNYYFVFVNDTTNSPDYSDFY